MKSKYRFRCLAVPSKSVRKHEAPFKSRHAEEIRQLPASPATICSTFPVFSLKSQPVSGFELSIHLCTVLSRVPGIHYPFKNRGTVTWIMGTEASLRSRYASRTNATLHRQCTLPVGSPIAPRRYQ